VAGLLAKQIKMRIKVKVKDIQIEVDDNDNNPVIKYESHNNEVQKTIKAMCEEAIKLLKERQLEHPH
jgi:glutamate formiminotransferase